MIKVVLDNSGYTGHILLEPNISLSWKTNLRILIGFSIVTLAIATYFFLKGGWLVLPFSGLEILVVSVSLYMFFNHNQRCEIIHFTDQKVVIEQGKQHAEKSWEYQRHWSKFHVEKKGAMDIPVVRIKSHGKVTELGSFLGYEEKLRLIETIKEVTECFRQSVINKPGM